MQEEPPKPHIDFDKNLQNPTRQNNIPDEKNLIPNDIENINGILSKIDNTVSNKDKLKTSLDEFFEINDQKTLAVKYREIQKYMQKMYDDTYIKNAAKGLKIQVNLTSLDKNLSKIMKGKGIDIFNNETCANLDTDCVVKNIITLESEKNGTLQTTENGCKIGDEILLKATVKRYKYNPPAR